MKAPTTFACRAAGLAILAASAAAAFAGGGGTSYPMGDIHQCSAAGDSCKGNGWSIGALKTVTCCCYVGNNVWKYCNLTIRVYSLTVAGQTWHCYRLLNKDVVDAVCHPIPNPIPDPIEPANPEQQMAIRSALKTALSKPKPLLEDKLRAKHILTGSCTWDFEPGP